MSTDNCSIKPKTKKEELAEVLGIFRNNLKLLRTQAGITVQEFSHMIEIKALRLYDLESGIRPPNFEEIVCIVDYFDITYDDLLDGKIDLHIKSRDEN